MFKIDWLPPEPRVGLFTVQYHKRHGLGSSFGGGKGNPLQYSCLENSMDGGVWWATVHGVATE